MFPGVFTVEFSGMIGTKVKGEKVRQAGSGPARKSPGTR